jgi:heme-degrading monooxygenase HmoA
MRGFRSLSLTRCIERASTYLLLVEWETIEDHTVGFRTSTAYDQWRTLLHHFYEPFPTVEHFVLPADHERGGGVGAREISGRSSSDWKRSL